MRFNNQNQFRNVLTSQKEIKLPSLILVKQTLLSKILLRAISNTGKPNLTTKISIIDLSVSLGS